MNNELLTWKMVFNKWRKIAGVREKLNVPQTMLKFMRRIKGKSEAEIKKEIGAFQQIIKMQV